MPWHGMANDAQSTRIDSVAGRRRTRSSVNRRSSCSPHRRFTPGPRRGDKGGGTFEGAAVDSPYRSSTADPQSAHQIYTNGILPCHHALHLLLGDSDGNSVPGFTLADCHEQFGDELERIVSWKSGTDVSKLSNKPVRLRFVLKDAYLYLFASRRGNEACHGSMVAYASRL